MPETWSKRRVLVLGLGAEGQGACRLLRQLGATVLGFERTSTPTMHDELRALGVSIVSKGLPTDQEPLDTVIVTPDGWLDADQARVFAQRGVTVLSELELAHRHARCLQVAVTGTNGKSTVADLAFRILSRAQRPAALAGVDGVAMSTLVDESHELDWLVLGMGPEQLAEIDVFRPVVAVLTNLAPTQCRRFNTPREQAEAIQGIFRNQQPFDWAIVQSEALAQMREFGYDVPSKLITYSAKNQRADLYVDRGLLISRLPGWTGPLLDLEKCQVRGLHVAEDFLAALALGHVLRVPLEEMIAELAPYRGREHCCETSGVWQGVRFINDARCGNLHGLEHAIQAIPVAPAAAPNVILIAGGTDCGMDFHDLGPLLSRRVKQALLLGDASSVMRAAWSLFTPCTVVRSLLEAVEKSAEFFEKGDVVLYSPACPSPDPYADHQERGEAFRRAVTQLTQQPVDGVESKKPNGPLADT